MFLSICYHIIINDDHLFWMNEWITTSNVWWRWWWWRPVNQFIYLWWWWEWLTGGKVNFFCILYNKCPASVVVVVVVVCLYLMVASLYKLLTSIFLPNAIEIGITFDRAIHFCSSFCSSIVYDWSQSSIFFIIRWSYSIFYTVGDDCGLLRSIDLIQTIDLCNLSSTRYKVNCFFLSFHSIYTYMMMIHTCLDRLHQCRSMRENGFPVFSSSFFFFVRILFIYLFFVLLLTHFFSFWTSPRNETIYGGLANPSMPLIKVTLFFCCCCCCWLFFFSSSSSFSFL